MSSATADTRPRPRGTRLVPTWLTVTALVALAAVTVPSTRAEATLTGLPSGFVDEVVAGGLPFPTAVAFTPDDRMFIALKSGLVRLYENGTLLTTPFVDIRDRVHDNHDRGLLGIAAHPQFPQHPYVYLLYTHDPPGVTPDQGSPVVGRVAQLLRVEADPATSFRTARPGSEVVLLGRNSTRENIGNELDGRNTSFASCMNPKNMTGTPVEDCIPSDENSHTIGSLVFGPDGSLYVSSGDASNYGGVDPRAMRAQLRDSLAGKILRIDPITGAGLPDNPFYVAAQPNSNRSKVWSSGLRNPFRITVHPVTGEAFIGDVGWNTWEEINTGKGANFGWPCYEGGAVSGSESGSTTSLRQGSYQNSTSTSAACAALYNEGLAAVAAPAFAYDHSLGGASANAGAFYTGHTYPPQYRNALFIADYNRRWIRYLTFDAQGKATVNNFGQENTTAGPVQVITGPDTNLYWMRYASSGGEVRRIRYTGAGNTPPVVLIDATPTVGLTPLTVQFNSDRSYDPDAQQVSYQWTFGDGATSTERNPTHTYTTAGVYDATLRLTETTAPFASSTATVRITVGNNPPLATITAPPDGTTYQIGDTITFTGTATSGGVPLPADAMRWEVRLRHNEHVHYSTPTSGALPGNPNVSTTSLTVEEHGDATSYQVCLIATVDQDLTDTQCVDLLPRTTDYTLTTTPVGLKINYEDEGLTLSAPAIIRPIVGSTQTVTVDPVQQSRSFVRWDDGVSTRSRTFVVGTQPTTFTAIYENTSPTAKIIASSATSGPAPLSVDLDGTESWDPEGDELQYSWTDGQGNTLTSATPTLTYSTPGTYRVGLTVTDKLGATGQAQIDIVVNAALPPPWQSQAIGVASDGGGATYSNGLFTVTTAGADIGKRSDAFRFVHRPVTGDVEIIARVDSLTASHPAAKAGLMVRQSLDPGSAHVAVVTTARKGTQMIWRSSSGANSSTKAGGSGTAPRWLRLVRSGSTVSAYESANGTSWTLVGSTTLSLSGGFSVGLAAASGNSSETTTTAVMSGVSVTTGP